MKKLIFVWMAFWAVAGLASAEQCIKTVTSDKEETLYSLATVQRITFDQNNDESSMRVQFKDGKADKTDVKTVIFAEGTPTEVAEFLGSGVAYFVFPNPVQQWLTIQGPEEGTEIFIYDLTGRLCSRQTADGADGTRLDVSNLTPGQYIIRAGSTALHFVKR